MPKREEQITKEYIQSEAINYANKSIGEMKKYEQKNDVTEIK